MFLLLVVAPLGCGGFLLLMVPKSPVAEVPEPTASAPVMIDHAPTPQPANPVVPTEPPPKSDLPVEPPTAVASSPAASATDAPDPDPPAALAGHESRTWTAANGKYTITAAFVNFANGKVRLRKDDDATIDVPLDELSAVDRAYVERLKDVGRFKSR